MIKMVACDVDGTLLMRGETAISERIIKTVKQLVTGGIIFVVASGRSYTDLKRLFREVENDVIFVCHDGALVMYKGNVLLKRPLDHKKGFELMKREYKNGAVPVVYGAYMTYVLKEQESFGASLRHTMNNHVLEVECMDKLCDDYLKIGIYKELTTTAAADTEAVLMATAGKDGRITGMGDKCFNLVYESREWREYVAPGVHKGSAILHLQKRFAVTKEETMAFGDNKNDLEMFEQAGVAYAVSWAAEEIKARCGYTTTSVAGTLEKVIV